MATNRDNTMIEALDKMLKDIAGMKTLADADMPFLISMENMVLGRMKQPVDQLAAQGVVNAPPSPPQPQPGMGGGMGMPAGSMQGGGLMAGPGMPSPDELQRLLSAGA